MSRRGRKQEVELRKARHRQEALELPATPQRQRRQLVAKRTPARGSTVEIHGRRYVRVELDSYRKASGGCCPFCAAVGQWICSCGTVNVEGDNRCRVCTGRREWTDAEYFDR